MDEHVCEICNAYCMDKESFDFVVRTCTKKNCPNQQEEDTQVQ